MSVYKIYEAAHIDPIVGATPQYVRSVRYSSPQHNHDYYEIFVITSGSCIHKVNSKEQHLAEGALVFIRPDDLHWYDFDGGNDCEFINIAYSSTVVVSAFNYLGNPQCTEKLLSCEMPASSILSPLEKDSLIDRFYALTTILSIDKASAGIHFRGLLIELLTRHFLGNWNFGGINTPLWFSVLIKQMQKKENFRDGLQKVYELSGRSKGHVNRAFKQYLNLTPTDYINHIRLNYAKNLLLTTGLNVLDIAFEAGFQNLSHFNHQFKAHFSMSPLKLKFYSGSDPTSSSSC